MKKPIEKIGEISGYILIALVTLLICFIFWYDAFMSFFKLIF
ncbi:MAG: hypothetical protein NTZ20_03215 [Candidatus Levybacteria bacterium]|nr:hypothetical protein [Candidatus Levybacteria bacterium]